MYPKTARAMKNRASMVSDFLEPMNGFVKKGEAENAGAD